MNNLLIEKIITSNNLPCPEFVYKNPLLDKNVAYALSKSFVTILGLPHQSTSVGNNLRISILENIRKICRLEPTNHAKVDENFTNTLSELYEKNSLKHNVNQTDSIEKSLDAFLVRRMKEMDLNSSYKSPANPEVIQAMINLNKNEVYLDNLSQDIIHWECMNDQHTTLLKNLCNIEAFSHKNKLFGDDIAIKLKAQSEILILDTITDILCDRITDIQDFFTSSIAFTKLIQHSSNSAECFQICTGILNFLFIMTNFDTKICKFIELFVRSIKQSCSYVTFSVLYPASISHIVILLDIDLDYLWDGTRDDYIKHAIKYLSDLHVSSENDLIMLLSHFPQWFDVYYNLEKSDLSMDLHE